MQRRIQIHGLGRSGTSWLLKIFDHHPMTVCSHEPERYIEPGRYRGRDLDREALERYVDDLFSSRPLRAMRRRPIMRKDYRSAPAHYLRNAYMYGLSGIGKLGTGLAERIGGLPVPDLARTAGLVHVAKCVGHHFILEQLINAVSDLKIIYLLRHPCGNVGSNVRGYRIGKMNMHYVPSAADMGRFFPAERIEAVRSTSDPDQLEVLAYRWAVMNGIFCQAAVGRPNVRILRYEDLCDDPIGVAQDLFAWAGIPWHGRVEAFLAASLAASGDADGYHDLTRNPGVAARKWQTEMDPGDIERVLDICRHSPAFAYYEAGLSDTEDSTSVGP